MVTQYRGDWKWHRATGQHLCENLHMVYDHVFPSPSFNHIQPILPEEWFLLSAWWRATNLCHACFMTKHDFLRVPNPLPGLPRRDLQNFMDHALRDDAGPSHLYLNSVKLKGCSGMCMLRFPLIPLLQSVSCCLITKVP